MQHESVEGGCRCDAGGPPSTSRLLGGRDELTHEDKRDAVTNEPTKLAERGRGEEPTKKRDKEKTNTRGLEPATPIIALNVDTLNTPEAKAGTADRGKTKTPELPTRSAL